MTGLEFYNYLKSKYDGTANNVDGVAGAQCADGFKIACRELGDPNWKRAIGGTGEYAGYAIWIYWNFYNNGYNEYFDLVPFEAGTLPAQLGDILVYGFTDETPASHVSFYAGSDYPGTHYSWGQNQGGYLGGFNTILLSDYGVEAILRPKLESPAPQPEPVPQPNESGFFDVEPGWYFDAVKWLHDNNLVTGTGGQMFEPGRAISRAEALTILWRFCGCPSVEGQINPFRDVQPNDYYYSAIQWANKKGITSGTGEYFNPNNPCNRAQAVLFLYRFCNAPDMGKMQIPYLDVSNSTYFYDAVRWSHAHQVTDCGNKFNPYLPCTRAQFAVMFYRTYRVANS